MWPNPQETAETADLVTFTEEIFNGKHHFLCSAMKNVLLKISWNSQESTFVGWKRDDKIIAWSIVFGYSKILQHKIIFFLEPLLVSY